MEQRILLIRLSAVGDVINTLPALTLLRRARPRAHLAYVVEDRARELLVGHPLLDQVYVFPRRRWRKMLRAGNAVALGKELVSYRDELRAARFDVSLDFQGNLKGAMHARFCGAPRRIGFAKGYGRELSHLLATEQVVPPADRPHRVDKFVSLLGPLGIEGSAREYALPPSPEARERVGGLVAARGLVGRRLALLHPGTSERGSGKRWPSERFAALAARIAAEGDARVWITWGPTERALAGSVAAAAGEGVEVAPETTSLLELAELLRRAAVFVSADTGPMHLAAACGTPCVALFGPKDPATYGPYGRGHTVLHHRDRPGSPGILRIGVDEVRAAVAATLRSRAA